jgi:hypothetical protein
MSTINDDLYIAGHLSSRTFTPAVGSVVNASVTGPIAASKNERAISICYSQARGVDNVDARTIVHRVHGAVGTLKSVSAKNAVTAQNSDTTTVDLLLNGSSMLTAPISIAAADTTDLKSGTLASDTLAVGDILEVVTNATGSDPGEGIAAFVEIDEDYN